MFALCIAYSVYYAQSSSCEKLLQEYSALPGFILALVLAWYIGFRPQSWIFSDMKLYAHIYEDLKVTYTIGESEWVFSLLIVICKALRLSSSQFFFVVALGYILLSFFAAQKLLKENTLIAFLFIIASFSFWGYGTNGIRNGLACSLVLYSMALYIKGQKLTPLILFVLAAGIHRSVLLPISMFLVAYYVIRNPKYAIYLWIVSVFVSLIAGNRIAILFASLGFDDRMVQYVANGVNITGEAERIGFRWDFLLYSIAPIVLTWYVVVKRNIQDAEFNIISTTYILSNMFWVLVIRAAFSNRFAYLSWFIYPLVFAYAFIRVPIWQDQDKKTGIALLVYSSFTMLMFAIGKLY